MNVQLDWQAGDENGGWEPVAVMDERTATTTFGWVSRRGWMVLLVALVTCAGAGYVLARHLAGETLRRAAFHIQTVVDLEARALQEGDADLYLAQQDAASPGWYAQQVRRVYPNRGPQGSGVPYACTSPETSLGDSSLVLRGRVEHVELMGDVAWVETAVERGTARQVRFYRQTDLGWIHTAPRAEFWRSPVELVYDNVVVRGHRRDLPYVEPLIRHAQAVLARVCAELDCPADLKVELHFVVRRSMAGLPARSGNRVVLPSPWLSGIPVAERWDEGYLDELTSQVAHGAVSQLAGSAADERAWKAALSRIFPSRNVDGPTGTWSPSKTAPSWYDCWVSVDHTY